MLKIKNCIAVSVVAMFVLALSACSSDVGGPEEHVAQQSSAAIPYATPGPDYNTDAGIPYGPCHNPWPVELAGTTVPLDQCGSWGTMCAADGTTVIYGLYSSIVSRRGIKAACAWQPCGTQGAGC